MNGTPPPQLASPQPPLARRPLVRLRPDRGKPSIAPSGLRAVLFDRDGTLVIDIPYNGDPDRVHLRPAAAAAVRTARRAGVAVGVVSNQSGIGRGLLTVESTFAVAERVEGLLGRFDVWVVCPHAPADGCRCRKPAPGGLLMACALLGLDPSTVGYVGDIGADVAAAEAGGLRPILVPAPATREEEIAAAPRTAPGLLTAVRALLGAPSREHVRAAPNV